ncbi:3-phosphoinositide-dependent protein kinase 2-like isoform X2 [Dioscorea cayenensis subsp. rotundata]|uniref:non-specific serine/threonine protein kinase n=1 Tax=Dioscorea cayennensis subsp. rotundata TaxID=55577 RepID=A0AB40BA84_DIOCR|nr:3-phosphoinositide-dependent protein kinase 2-like isoform X2 [Dioscorea cayenensis subsp. rotundata]
MVVGGEGDEIERNFQAKVRLEPRNREEAAQRISIAFRAPQENFTIRDFELGKVLGVGSHSKVVRAKKKGSEHVYALKIMDKDFIIKENKVTCVKLERIVLDQLDHPGIVGLYFTFQDARCLYMALESCEGGELFDLISKRGRLSEIEARFYTAEVVEALEYLHGLGLIHCDIRPENLLLTADGHIKIADFGCVRPDKDSRITVPLNLLSENTQAFTGRTAYAPPEIQNSSPASPGNDLWALGCTLYHMLAGASPFKDAFELLVFQRIISRGINIPEYFSDEASDLIDKLLDIDPSRRLGAGPDGYLALKLHPFFKGIDWHNLRQGSVRKLAMEFIANKNNEPYNSTQNGSHQQSSFDRSSGSTSSSETHPHLSSLSSIDSFDSKWRDFLEPGESILMTSKLKKFRKLKSKKVQLILTDKPRLISVNANKLMEKKIVWSDNPNSINVQVVNSSHFKITTPTKVMSFEDAKQRAWQWKKTVEGLQKP